jgi:uncharacterized membrane protein
MRQTVHKYIQRDKRLNLRGEQVSRLENLTDAVFGIAITLLIFNLSNPNSYDDILNFAKTVPAFIISVAFLLLIWKEHLEFSEVYGMNDIWIITLNTLFIAAIIFFVYPLRFLTLFLTNLFFGAEIHINISAAEVPQLMIYYGSCVFSIYFILFLFYLRIYVIRNAFELNHFEVFYTRWNTMRMALQFIVPLLSISTTLLFNCIHPQWSSFAGGMVYFLYFPVNFIWYYLFEKKSAEIPDTD